jgi:hypothetical protein
MNYSELSASELIYQLSIAGEYPHPDLIDAIHDRRAETAPLMLAMFDDAYDDSWPDGDPRWYRFIHAGKFLLSWQNVNALPTFARMYSSDGDGMSDICEWFEEDLYHFGPAAIPYLKPIIIKEMGKQWHYGKALTGSILTRIATYYPETREEIIAIFQAQLPPVDISPDEIDEMWDSWASELGELADETSRDQILALFANEAIESTFIDEQDYRALINRGFRPQKPPKPYDICAEYRRLYEDHLSWQKRLAREEGKGRRIRQAKPRTEPKVGRNDPCPCGSGKKYKKCHGRPGA